jgi:hypothetical protein
MAGEASSEQAEDRYERERAFHDARVEDDQCSHATAKYYAVDSAGKRYRELLGRSLREPQVLEYGCGTGSAAFDLAARGRGAGDRHLAGGRGRRPSHGQERGLASRRSR